MRVIVWSQNPRKVEAVKLWFEKCSHTKGQEIKTIALDAPSLVSDMPTNIEEVIEWARNRAKFCKRIAPDWHYSVGIEWGTTLIADKAYLFWAVVIIDQKDRENICMTTMIQLPAIYKKRLYEDWKGLEEIAEELSNITKIWKKWWTYSIITKDEIDRETAFTEAVRWALSRFYSVIK